MKQDLRHGVALPHLLAWRSSRLMSQEELARRARVHRNTIGSAEHGRPVNLVNVARLAKALGITRQQLVYESSPQEGGSNTHP